MIRREDAFSNAGKRRAGRNIHTGLDANSGHAPKLPWRRKSSTGTRSFLVSTKSSGGSAAAVQNSVLVSLISRRLCRRMNLHEIFMRVGISRAKEGVGGKIPKIDGRSASEFVQVCSERQCARHFRFRDPISHDSPIATLGRASPVPDPQVTSAPNPFLKQGSNVR